MQEMRESTKIILQCRRQAARKTPGPVMTEDNKVSPPRRAEMKRSMEALIHHFKLYTEGFRIAGRRGLRLRRGPQGRVRRLSGQPTAPTSRTAARSAPRASRTWQAMDWMNRGHMLADVSAILGSLDIVFGEVDR